MSNQPIIRAKYDELENIATRFAKQAQNNVEMLQRVQRAMNQLQQSGWVGKGSEAFFNEMQREVLPACQRLVQALQQSQTTTKKISGVLKQAEEEAAKLFKGESNTSHASHNGGGGTPSNSESGDVPGGTPEGVPKWSRFYKSIEGKYSTDPHAKDDKPENKHFQVEGFANFGEKTFNGPSDALYHKQFGDVEIGAGGYNVGGKASWGVGKDGVQGKLEGGAEAYLLQAKYSKEMAGFDVSAEAQIGASIKGDAQLSFNPLKGDAKVEAGVEAFAGGTVQAQVKKEVWATETTVQGEIGYGIGIKAKGDVGFKDWKFKAEGNLGAYLGVGGGVKVSVELDVRKAGNDLMKIGEEGLKHMNPLKWF